MAAPAAAPAAVMAAAPAAPAAVMAAAPAAAGWQVKTAEVGAVAIAFALAAPTAETTRERPPAWLPHDPDAPVSAIDSLHGDGTHTRSVGRRHH
jgi:hypothetical protein